MTDLIGIYWQLLVTITSLDRFQELIGMIIFETDSVALPVMLPVMLPKLYSESYLNAIGFLHSALCTLKID